MGNKNIKDIEWALHAIEDEDNDPRKLIKYRVNYPITDLKDMLEKVHDKFGERPAFYEKLVKGEPYQKITYNQMYDDVNGLGTRLIDLGLKDNKIVVIGETTYGWSISYLAVTCGTGVCVPMDKELPIDDLKNLIKVSEATAVIFDSKREEKFIEIFNSKETNLKFLISQDRESDFENILSLKKLIKEGKELLSQNDTRFLDVDIDTETTAVIIFTSGTTGMAKGIMLSQRNICSVLMICSSILNIVPDDIFFSVLPVHHTYECTAGFLEPLYKGASIAHCEGLKYIVKNMNEIHPTVMLGVPAIFEALHRQIWKGIEKKGKTETVKKAMKLSNALRKVGIDVRRKLFKDILDNLGGDMKIFICGGAAINPEILDNFNAFGIVSVQGYGLSEASPIGALNPDTRPKSNSIGIVLPGYQIKTIDVNEDGIGELCLKGDNIMLGYYKNPEATNEALKDGWFLTGDLGYVDNEGYAYITGRKKNVIITKNGKNVFPEELEYELSQNDLVKESMVFQDDSENKDDTIIVAAIYPDYEQLNGLTDDEIKAKLWEVINPINEKNPPYKMIKKLVLRHTELEKNTSKKIKRFVKENKLEM